MSLLQDLIYWMAISAVIGVPLFVSLYIMVTPTQKLMASWQNFRMSRSPHRALKDRHFKGLPGRIRLCKIACFPIFLVALWALLEQMKVDVWGLLQRLTQ